MCFILLVKSNPRVLFLIFVILFLFKTVEWVMYLSISVHPYLHREKIQRPRLPDSWSVTHVAVGEWKRQNFEMWNVKRWSNPSHRGIYHISCQCPLMIFSSASQTMSILKISLTQVMNFRVKLYFTSLYIKTCRARIYI